MQRCLASVTQVNGEAGSTQKQTAASYKVGACVARYSAPSLIRLVPYQVLPSRFVTRYRQEQPAHERFAFLPQEVDPGSTPVDLHF